VFEPFLKDRLGTVNPNETALVEGSAGEAQNAPVNIDEIRWTGLGYAVRYSAQAAAFLRVAVPWASGWRVWTEHQWTWYRATMR
jgi:hypothetical protein